MTPPAPSPAASSPCSPAPPSPAPWPTPLAAWTPAPVRRAGQPRDPSVSGYDKSIVQKNIYKKYFFQVFSSATDWLSALRSCIAEGGTLAKVESAAENSVVQVRGGRTGGGLCQYTCHLPPGPHRLGRVLARPPGLRHGGELRLGGRRRAGQLHQLARQPAGQRGGRGSSGAGEPGGDTCSMSTRDTCTV